MSSTAMQLLHAALQGGHGARPLIAPLCTAVAGELQGLPPGAVLYDVTKLSNGLRDLMRSLPADVAVAEFGTLWEAEALGLALDWSVGWPPLPQGSLTVASAPDLLQGRGPLICEAIRRLSALLPDRVVAAGVCGPGRLARLAGGTLGAVAAAELLLPAVRLLCDAGAKLIWLVEAEEPESTLPELAAALQPIWQSIRFYQALGVLHLAGAADHWLPLVREGGPFVPCFDPEPSPALADWARNSGACYGLALPPGPLSPAAQELARTGRCVVLTNDGELAGRVAVRELRKVVSTLRNSIA